MTENRAARKRLNEIKIRETASGVAPPRELTVDDKNAGASCGIARDTEEVDMILGDGHDGVVIGRRNACR
jgi:hypothetical protein